MVGNNITPDDLLQRAYALDNDADTQKLYQDWAETYDQSMLEGLKYLTPGLTADMLAHVLDNRDAAILDVGSGTGLAGQNLAEHGFSHIDALDFSPAMLEVAKRRKLDGKNVYINIINADLKGPLFVPDGSYDAMICTGTFTHAHVGAECLDELFRILKPGGLFACTVHKDIWEAEGFATKTASLQSAGLLNTRSMEMGVYFETDTEPQGWFILWEKTHA